MQNRLQAIVVHPTWSNQRVKRDDSGVDSDHVANIILKVPRPSYGKLLSRTIILNLTTTAASCSTMIGECILIWCEIFLFSCPDGCHSLKQRFVRSSLDQLYRVIWSNRLCRCSVCCWYLAKDVTYVRPLFTQNTRTFLEIHPLSWGLQKSSVRLLIVTTKEQ